MKTIFTSLTAVFLKVSGLSLTGTDLDKVLLNKRDIQQEFFDSRKVYFAKKINRLINKTPRIYALTKIQKKYILDEVLENIGFTEGVNIFNVPNPSDPQLMLELMSVYNHYCPSKEDLSVAA